MHIDHRRHQQAADRSAASWRRRAGCATCTKTCIRSRRSAATITREDTVVDAAGATFGGGALYCHRRPVCSRIRGADSRSRRVRGLTGRQRPAWRGLQAAHVALCVSGAGCARPAVLRAAATRNGLGGSQRGHGDRPDCRRREVPRRAADRRAQHAELRPAEGSRQDRQAGAAQARAQQQDRRAAARGRVHRRRRQPARDSVRARDPDVRDGHAQHAGHCSRASGEATDAPADHHRPQPRRGQSASTCAR